MNLFVVQLSPHGGADEEQLARAVGDLLAEIPFLPDAVCSSWRAPSGRCALATASHRPEQIGGIRYVVAERHRAAAFSGRPFVWTGEFEADGRAPLAPEFYLRPTADWIDRIDGRWAAVRYDDEQGELEVCSDPLGSYPVYVGGRGDLWFSNSPELIRRLAGSRGSRPSTLASFFASGASIDGVPRWDGVDRLPAGLQRFNAPFAVRRGPSTIDWRPLLNERFDVEIAARRLVAVVRAIADWPGRPAFVPLSGGRDSRVVLAAALAAGCELRARTMAIPGLPGYPETRDVVLARALCARAGLAHELIEPVPLLPPAEQPALLGVLSPGTISLELAAQAAFARPIPGVCEPIEIVQTGHGGEVARTYYGIVRDPTVETVTERLVSRTMPAVPRPLLSPAGKSIYRDAVHGWVERQLEAGVPASALVDLFYLDQRMPHWIAISQGVSEYVHDLANPFWSRRLIPQEMGLAPEQRRLELFHLQLIRALAPALLEIRFDVEAFPGAARRGRSLSAGRARTAAKLLREARRRVRGSPGPDLLPEVARLVQQAVEGGDANAAWQVLDRKRVHRLLTRSPRRLDRRSRSMIWRLATVLLVDDREERHERAPVGASRTQGALRQR